MSEWVAVQIADGNFYEHEYWLPFVTVVPDGLIEECLQSLEGNDLQHRRLEGIVAVIAACANAKHAAHLFARVRDLQRTMDATTDERHDFEWHIMRQLETAFRRLPDKLAAVGVLSSVTMGDPLDIKVAASLLSRVARSDSEPLEIDDADLRARIRAYLKGSIDLVLREDDFDGEEKANLASSISQVGQPEDIVDLVTLIRADIERMRRGRATRAVGDREPLGGGVITSFASWHISSVIHLDAAGAVQVLIDLLPAPEYLSVIAEAMARDFMPRPESPFGRSFRHALVWAAREGRDSRATGDEERRTRFAAVLNAEMKRLREQMQDGKPAAGLKELAKSLAAVDGSDSAAVVLDEIAEPGEWEEYACVDAAERLLMGGVVLPAAAVFALVDSVLERTEKWMQNSDVALLCRSLALCPWIDDSVAGIAKMRDVLGKRRLAGYVLREVVTALGESRSADSVGLLEELASDVQTFNQCKGEFINAFATLDTERTRELLLGFVDPNAPGIALSRNHGEKLLVARLTELAQRRPEVAARLRGLCERDLPELNRHVLSLVMDRLGTPEAIAASLALIHDSRPSPIPRGVWNQLESAFVERRPYEQDSNAFTQHARASNELRVCLFRMAIEDDKRRKTASMLLGQIEEWRLKHGRPTGESRHPDLTTGQSWPPRSP